jgi:hypothetical protein
MEFGVPQKLPDGRRFLKITGCVVQLNGARLQEGLAAPSITVDVPESLYDKISAIDEQVLTKAKESKQEWFGADLKDETIQGAFQSSLTDGTLSAALAKIKGEVVAKAFDCQKQEVELSSVAEGAQCDLLVELAGLWFLKKSFGAVWRIVQARVRSAPKAPAFPTQYMFEDEVEEEPAADDPADYID